MNYFFVIRLMVFFRRIGGSTVAAGIALLALLVSLIALGIKDTDRLFGYSIAVFGFPFVLNVTQKAKWKMKYALISLLMLIGYLALGVETLCFLAVCFAGLCIIENVKGEVSFKALCYLFISTPFFDFIAQMLSFPIRLKLTNWAVKILEYAYPGITSEGNVIFKTKSLRFSVDPECMGLNMVSMSLAVGLIITTILEKEKGYVLNKLETISAILTMLCLAIFSNFMRIITLVVMESFPHTAGHEIIGLTCLLMYAFAPFYFLAKLYFRNKSSDKVEQKGASYSSPIQLITVATFNVLVAGALVFAPVRSHVEDDPSFAQIQLDGYQKELLSTKVLKLESEDALVYIKPSVDFYGAHHSPLICWTGSGYAIQNRKAVNIDGHNIWMGKLAHQNDTLHTAWWFDNGIVKDNDNWDWRWDMLQGAPAYRLVNVTCTSPQLLQREVNKLLGKNLFDTK